MINFTPEMPEPIRQARRAWIEKAASILTLKCGPGSHLLYVEHFGFFILSLTWGVDTRGMAGVP
jgi:hypothetical protein